MKLRRKILLLILALSTLAFTCLGAGCNEMLKETCQHEKDAQELIALEDAACGEECEVTWTCKVCGEVITKTVATSWHVFDEGTTTLEPTCTEKGTFTYTCIDCGAITNTDIPELGHSPIVDNKVAPTCTATGLEEGSHCSRCDVVLTPQATIAKLKHNFDHGDTCADCGTEQRKTTLTFVVEGETFEEIHYDVNTTELTPPEIPEKNGYTATWESFDLDYENATVNAVYEPIVYKIVYHVNSIYTNKDGVTTITKDFKGTWEEFWRPKSTYLSNITSVTEYTIESEDIKITTDFYREIQVAEKYSVVLEDMYTDELCTQKFSGLIPKGSTGDIHLYIEHTISYFGPY